MFQTCLDGVYLTFGMQFTYPPMCRGLEMIYQVEAAIVQLV